VADGDGLEGAVLDAAVAASRVRSRRARGATVGAGAGQQRPKARDLLGRAADPRLGQHRAGGVSIASAFNSASRSAR
jgi:hypothetical protein